MPKNDLKSEYERLCEELEEAYAAPVWDSREIDRITNSMAKITHLSMRLSPLIHPALSRDLDTEQA